MKLQSKILFLLLLANSICSGQYPTSSDSIFHSIIENPRTELDKKTYSGGIIKEFYELKNERNEWITYNEFDSKGRLKEKGVYLNGYNFDIWTKYDSIGRIISQIDYSIPKQIIGQNQTHFKEFAIAKEIGDSIIRSHFDSAFVKSIRLNAPRSYWYTANNSGSWFERTSENPKKFTLRYSIIIRDTLYFTPIVISIKNKKVTSLKGITNNDSFKIEVGYQKALDIAKSKGYDKIHVTAFKKREYLDLIFDVETKKYYWIVSKVNSEIVEYSDNKNHTTTGIGKTLFIDCNSGDSKENNFQGIQNSCQ